MRNDVIAKIKTARAEAQTKVNAYKNITANSYNYCRTIATVTTYNEALAMFAQGTEDYIPDMAAKAIADFERARDSDTDEMTLAVTGGRRDALASVADWMDNR